LEAATLKRSVFLALSLLLLILIQGCITVLTPATNTMPVAITPPIIIEFSNNPPAITSGGSSTLLWNVTGANSVSIDQGVGQVAVAGTLVISPTKSTVYTISATNSAGTVIRSSTIIIVSIVSATALAPLAKASDPTILFSASHRGGTSWQLNWNIANATQIIIQPDIGPINPIGSTMVTVPSRQTKLYRLEAINDVGWAYRQIVMASP
jgi:hypothetical protein